MNSIEALIKKCDPDLVWHSSPASSEVISKCANFLGVLFPESYRMFLQKYGAFSIGDNSISGVIENSLNDIGGGSVVGDTLRAREELGLPSELVVIQSSSEALYCLRCNTQAPEEVPVICYEVFSKNEKVIANSFSEWVELFIFCGQSNG